MRAGETAISLRPEPTHASEKPVTNSASFAAIDAYVEREMRRLKIPGVSLAIVEGDRIVDMRGFGRACPGGEAPTPQTPFILGSVTKSFTALAVMQLVEAGKIELDAPVQRCLPWFQVADPEASALITVRHLLNQTSGLPDWAGEITLADFDDSPNAAERQARALATLELSHPVGSAFEYSNVNYSLLGLIIEAAGGESYANYIQEHIFLPLGMSHSYSSLLEAKQNGLAVGHQFWFGLPVAAPNMPIPHGSLAAGLLISCAEDMARYLIALLNGGRCGNAQILSPAGIEELHRGAVGFSAMGRSLGQYGMGWFTGEIGQMKLAWHGGTLPDFGSYVGVLPEQKQGVVLLFNACHHWMNPVLAEFGISVTALLAGEEHKPIPFVSMIPWMLRGQLLIPALQIADVFATLRRFRSRSVKRQRPLQLLLLLIPNLLVVRAVMGMLGKRRPYLRLYMPDSFWLVIASGSLGLAWGLLRIRMILRTTKSSSRPRRRSLVGTESGSE